MSGQASSPNGSFSNVAAGCSMREGSSRSSTNNNNSNNNHGSAAAASASASAASHRHQQHHQQQMMLAAFGETSNGSGSGSGSAGISSSGSSRSTARFAAAAAAGFASSSSAGAGSGSGSNSGASAMQGVTTIGGESGENENAAAAATGGGGGVSNNDNAAGNYQGSNNHHHHHNDYPSYPNNVYSNSTAGAPSSQHAGSSGISTSSSIKSHHHNHHNTNTITHYQQQQQQQQHYSQYSLPFGELTVYSWGRGEDGQLGIGDTSDQDEPTYVDSLRGVGVKQIACGSGHTVVLTGEGEVYTWGRGDDGRLGHGDNGWKYVPRLTHSLTGQIVTHVTCGSYHTAAVSSNGDLFTWGGGMYGKLGHGNESGHSTPRRVETLVGLSIVDIACGSRHTAVVTNKGCLYTWGDKENGVAGHGDTEGHQYTPKLLERLSGKKVVQLSACGFHTGCLTDMGECVLVYTWGEGKFGRLGHGAERNCHSPRLVESLLGKRPIQIACGGFHSAVVTQDGKMYTFGGGEHGQLGHGDKVNKVKPTLVQALEAIFLQQITCGWSHSVALTSKGEVYTWGNGDHGKLGHGSGKKVSTPQLVEKLVGQKVVRVASYNEHTACLVEPQSMTQEGSRRAAPGTMVPISAVFLQDFSEMVNDEEYSDVTFVVEGRSVYALRAVLAKRCEHFAAMFRSGMRECEEGAEIPIPNMSYAVFLLILEYLYTDSVKIDLEHAVELYIASDLYQLSTLRGMCCVVVRRSIGSENASYLLQSAHEAHCQVMKDIAMEYIVANFDIISKSEGIKAVSHGLLLEILSLRP
ncbi:hypothetical protein ACHAXR_004851 [Thalassiosira sp. AJA248-18]